MSAFGRFKVPHVDPRHTQAGAMAMGTMYFWIFYRFYHDGRTMLFGHDFSSHGHGHGHGHGDHHGLAPWHKSAVGAVPTRGVDDEEEEED